MKQNLLSKNKVSIAVAVICSVTLLANTYITRMKLYEESKTHVVVASMDISENTEITKEMIKIVEMDIESVNENLTFKDPSKVLGSSTLVPIFKGEPLNPNRLYPTNDAENEDFVLQINPVDKALDIKEGSFIDIWKIPTAKGLEASLTPELVIVGHRVDQVKNESIAKVEPKKEETKSSEAAAEAPAEPISPIPTYLILNMTGTDIQLLTSIDSGKYSIRVALHREGDLYQNFLNQSKKGESDVAEAPTVDVEDVTIEEAKDKKALDDTPVVDQAAQGVVQNPTQTPVSPSAEAPDIAVVPEKPADQESAKSEEDNTKPSSGIESLIG